MLLAVRENGKALVYATKQLRADGELVAEAVANNGLALQYASAELKNDFELVKLAVQMDGLAIAHASDALQKDATLRGIAAQHRAANIVNSHWEGAHARFASPAPRHASPRLPRAGSARVGLGRRRGDELHQAPARRLGARYVGRRRLERVRRVVAARGLDEHHAAAETPPHAQRRPAG